MARTRKPAMSRSEFETALSELAAAMRIVNTNITLLGKAKQKLEEQFAARREAAEETMSDRWKAVCAYAETHRSDLVGDAKSTEILGTTLGWRTNPPSVRIDADVGEEGVIDAIKMRDLDSEYLRERVELNKQAILANPDIAKLLRGVTVVTDEEEFFVKLPEADFEKRKKVASRTSKPRSRVGEIAKSGGKKDPFMIARDADARKMRPIRKRK